MPSTLIKPILSQLYKNELDTIYIEFIVGGCSFWCVESIKLPESLHGQDKESVDDNKGPEMSHWSALFHKCVAKYSKWIEN